MSRGETGFARLVGVEIHRLLSRRLLRILAAVVVAGMVVAAGLVAANSHPSTPGGSFSLTHVRHVLLGTSAGFAILAFLIGATSIGAEWHAGTVTTLLTWEPRRIRVAVAKALSVVLVAFGAILVLQALLAGALALVAATRGVTVGADRAWLADTAGIAVRAAAVAAAMSLVGYALASIGRNTGAALGVGFAYFAVIEGLIRGLRPHWQPWLVGDNSASFIADGDVSRALGRSSLASGVLVGVYALVATAIAVAVFRARDVS